MARSGRTSWWPQPASGPVRIQDEPENYLQLPKLSTTERDALTAVNGIGLYNETLNYVQWYENGAWNGSGAYLPLAGGTLTGNLTLSDDIAVAWGSATSIIWETQDADANELLIDLPTGGAVDVPVIVIGQGVTGVDLGLYNGVVNPTIAIFGIGAVTTAPVWEFRKARGTIAVPTIITTGDDLGTINFWGYSGSTGYHLSAAIEVDSTGTIGPTGTVRVPSVMRFRTSTDAAPSVLTTAITIGANQAVTLAGALGINGGFTGVTNFEVVTGGRVELRGTAYFLTDNEVDSATTYFKCKDTGVGMVEVMRWLSAADPYVQIGRDDTGVALNAVTDMLVLQAGGGTGIGAIGMGFGLAIYLDNASSEVEKRASIEWSLIDATNASEDVQLVFKLQAAGAAPSPTLKLSGIVTALGFNALASNTGSYNSAFGVQALYTNIDGAADAAFGFKALYANSSGECNSAFGFMALYNNTIGSKNSAFGDEALYTNISGSYNSAFGFMALYNSTGDDNVALGSEAGYYETGSNKLFIDNARRASEADGRLKALIYGVFAVAPANQYLTINGNLIMGASATVLSAANNADGDYLVISARDTGVGLVQIGCLIGAADPYLQIGRDDVGVGSGTCTNGTGIMTGSPVTLVVGANTPTVTAAGTFTVVLPTGSTGTAATGGWTVTGSPQALVAGNNTVTVEAGGTGTITITLSGSATVVDGLVLQMGSGTANEVVGQGFGSSWKIGNAASEVEERGSIDLVLQTATNAAEDASYIFRAMVAGAMATVLSFGGYAGVSKLGFYATAPVAKPSAYTQTYATADKTHAAMTSADMPAGGTGTAAGGWDTAANRDTAIADFAELRADVIDVKQVVNALIDDLQALGLVG